MFLDLVLINGAPKTFRELVYGGSETITRVFDSSTATAVSIVQVLSLTLNFENSFMSFAVT